MMQLLLPKGSKNKPAYTRKWEWLESLVSSETGWFHPESTKETRDYPKVRQMMMDGI
jgi:hypothetical protein